MDQTNRHQAQLERLRLWRNRKQRDVTLNFLPDLVNRDYEKPHRQMGKIIEIWQQYIPTELVNRSKLVSLQRGLLLIHVQDSPTLYQLNQVLRSGAEKLIKQAHRGNIFRIQLKIQPDDPI